MTSPAAATTLASDDETQAAIIGFLTQRFPGLAAVDVNADTELLDSGHLDSLGVLDVMMFIGDHFNVAISDEDFLPEHFETVSSLCDFVRQAASA